MKDLFLNVLNKLILILIKFDLEIKVQGRNVNLTDENDLGSLINDHFDQLNEPNHPCKESLTLALNSIFDFKNMCLHLKLR